MRNRIDDYFIEWRLNIRTTGRKDIDTPDAVPYSTFAFHGIDRVLDRLDLQPDDVVADVGCGKGRVVCAAGARQMKKAIGIEIDAQLCEQARQNARAMR